MRDISPDMSFLEVLDAVNEQLTIEGHDPIAFDSDCREGIYGAYGVMIRRAGETRHAQVDIAPVELHRAGLYERSVDRSMRLFLTLSSVSSLCFFEQLAAVPPLPAVVR